MDRSAAISQSDVSPTGLSAPERESLSSRIVICGVEPEVDGGRYPVKATVGDTVEIACDVLTDGHDQLGAAVTVAAPGGRRHVIPMTGLGNDRWRAQVPLTE